MEIRYKRASAQRDKPAPESFMGDQDRLDYILEKIKKTGFNSLNEEEKKFLDDASQK